MNRSDVLADSSRWMRQAERDLAASEVMLDGGHPDWACFCAQQAAEKAIKCVRIASGTPIDQIKDGTLGHDITRLLGTLVHLRSDPAFVRVNVLTPLERDARYPSYDEKGKKPPCESIDSRQAKEAIRLAAGVLDYCKRLLPDFAKLWK